MTNVKPCVLVADDSRTIATVLSLSLRKSGFEVSVAGSGEDALRIARGGRFDLILSDHQMLEMSGIDLCRLLRSRPVYRSTPFILLTAAHFSGELRRLSDAAGVTRVLGKPFSPAEVTAIARRYTARDGEAVEHQ